MPEFVSGGRRDPRVRALVGILPATAPAPPGSGFLTQVEYLVLPALCLVFVLFGYIARHGPRGHDRGARRRLHAHGDHQGPAASHGAPAHVLRNSLLPTIAVVATQAGYLIGGLVAIELLFNYQGIGQLICTRRARRTSRCCRARCWSFGIVYLVATLLADIAVLAAEPAGPLRRVRVSTSRRPRLGASASTPVRWAASPDEAKIARRERSAAAAAARAFIAA